VEILPDGASALYGSDAVGGVVNFILREDFEGVETRLRAGAADGVDEYRASQAVGNSWDSGNFLASVEYFDRELLNASDRDFVPPTSLAGSLAPEVQNYSGLLTVQQQLGGAVNMFADVLYAKRESFNRAGRVTLNETTDTENVQGVGTLGVDWNFAGDWVAQLSGSYARNDIEQLLFNTSVTGLTNNLDRDSVFNIEAGELKADGTLFTLPGGNVRAALGIGYRNETYEDQSRNLRTGALTQNFDVDQTIRSAFGEVYVPMVGRDNAFSGVNRLELSLAGRYDDYSTAGSSFDPQAGLMWEPVGGLRLRARYNTSYKAPNLVDYSFSNNFGQAARIPVPGATTPQVVLSVGGIDVNSLAPQESESSSFGLEIAPESMPGFDVGINYYKIRYSGLIATPANGNPLVILANQAAFQDLIIRDPGVDVVNQFIGTARLGAGFLPSIPNFTPDLVDIIVDARRRNLSVVRAEGLDLATNYTFKVASSSVTLGLNGTYILNQEQQVSDASPEIETVDTIFNPPNWRARGFIGWQMQGWAANVFVNHTDSYVDNRSLLRPAVDSFTTFDTRLAYDFSKRFSSGVLSGLTVAFNAQNVLDEDPPRVAIAIANSAEAGFDATNADPLGRFISLEITKVW
jgi:outer membrane receptor protein involved in Fe transport